MKKITEKTINKFESYLIDEEKSRVTIEKYIRDIKHFAAWLGDTALCKAKTIEYKEYLAESYAPSSVNSMLSSLNSFFEYISERGLKVKTLRLQHRSFADTEKELSKEEYLKLLKTAKNTGNTIVA